MLPSEHEYGHEQTAGLPMQFQAAIPPELPAMDPWDRWYCTHHGAVPAWPPDHPLFTAPLDDFTWWWTRPRSVKERALLREALALCRDDVHAAMTMVRMQEEERNA
jgi:hypothetical protein